MHVVASHDHHAPTCGKQQDKLSHGLSGTLGTGVAFQGIKRVVVHTIVTVPLG
jgi:hypothetical protein